MKSSILSAAAAVAAILWSGLPASAQSEAQVSMKIDLVAWGDSISGLTLKSAKGRDPVTALAFRYSKAVSYSGPAVLDIYQGAGSAEPAPAAEGAAPAAAAPAAAIKNIAAALAERRKKEPNLVSMAILPPESKHVTVLLAPGPSGTYQAYVIDDDPSKLPYGKMRIHNLSPLPIAMKCNNKPANILKNNGSVVVSPENKEVIYELAYQENGEWVTQENNIASVKDSEQAQLIVLKSDADFFTSSDGSRSGYLQTVVLRREKDGSGGLAEMSASEKAALAARIKQQEEEMEKQANPENGKPKK